MDALPECLLKRYTGAAEEYAILSSDPVLLGCQRRRLERQLLLNALGRTFRLSPKLSKLQSVLCGHLGAAKPLTSAYPCLSRQG